ncbi:alpha-mannosidase [Paenibacillus ihbetae]|uniref:Alpha-mannosidase n=1 Tax=Paenibacillus ihbetae TaxID=1870820 RepID=A0ABX3JSC5_9BACL|nr:alpha-mannosidase [Paenibacillus ihbetae]OOC60597.1 alpha-mannosidase [Paenibacillus ihbetae]
MERIRRFIRELSERQWLESVSLRDWSITRSTYVVPGVYEHSAPYTEGEDFNRFPSKQGTTYFFRRRLELPKEWLEEAGTVGLIFESGGEGLLRVNGASYHGLDRNHTFVTLDPERTGTRMELEIELYDPIPEPVDPLNQQAVIQPPITRVSSQLVKVNRPVQSLMYTVIIVRDSLRLLPESDMRRIRLMEALHAAMDAFVSMDEGSIREGAAVTGLEQELVQRVKRIGSNSEGTEHMVGQSHIDIAWLWPVRETVRKTSRTFSTVDALMNEYPEYRYAQSQPLLYQFLKDHDPELYERVKARIKEGRWELVGGMWVEPDLNIPSGESLMRQMLYGQLFYQEEFGRRSHIEWLPDTFGYCASLPQILKHGGIRYFMTTKLGWNDTNVFPYDLFHWVGIDGTPMLSYLNHGVNENTLPKDVHDHWQSYRQKAVHPEQMLLYGHGDGGGGVTREMLENIHRADLMVGQPASKYSTAAQFFDGIEKGQPKLPKWRGDLYLELHRGTYTTHARNKRHNRKAEILYREAELWGSMAFPALDPGERKGMLRALHEGWKLILLNQFHDIIPGSAITESYVTSEKEYKEVFKLGQTSLHTAVKAVAEQIDTDGEGIPYVVFNGLGWTRDAVISLREDEALAGHAPHDADGTPLLYDIIPGEPGAEPKTMYVYVPAIPGLGYTTIWLKATGASEPGDSLIDGRHDESNDGRNEELNDKRNDELIDDSNDNRNDDQTNDLNGNRNTGRDNDLNHERIHELKDGDAGSALAIEQIQLGDVWETKYYRIRFNDRGEITSLWDKEAQREIVKPGEAANRFHFFHDRPTLWDAWDIDTRYEEQPAGDAELIGKQLAHQGAVQDVLRFSWRIHESVITQDMILYHHDKRIDFQTHVSWNESHKLLKVSFPIDVVADKATYEIPFGTIERPTHRNTSWEQAQYEVCGHRFADVSEHGYGVSLINDCKYGYDIQDSTIRLSLLRAPKWPDQTADLGEHVFTYSLYPHEGDWRQAGVVRKAAELNHELPCVKTSPKKGTLAPAHSWIELDSLHVVLDTVKPAEDGSGYILRLYESAGGREEVRLGWPHAYEAAYLSNALEEELEPIVCEAGSLTLAFKPYEIQTIKLTTKN